MMDRNRYALKFTALTAGALVTLDRKQANLLPVSPSVCFRATYISRMVLAAKMSMDTFKAATSFVLLSFPRSPLKGLTAVDAGKILVCDQPFAFYLLRSKAISRTKTLAILISKLMSIGHTSICQMPFTATLITTKPCLLFPVRLDGKSRTTNFAY